MNLRDFIQEFAESHSVQHIDDLNGVVIASLNQDYYLVDTGDVNEWVAIHLGDIASVGTNGISTNLTISEW